MDPVILWTKCAHAGAHVRDLTMEGAFAILVSGIVSWVLRTWWGKGPSHKRDD